MKMSKKGQANIFGNLTQLGIGLTILVVLFAVIFLVMSNVATNSQVAANPNATAAVTTTMRAADDIPDWIPLIVIVILGGLIIFLVSRFGGGAV